MENSSVNGLISSALASRKAPEFAFITITNPSQIKDSRKQTVIRRHARASTSKSTISSKQQRRKRLKLVFDLPEATVKSNAAILQSTNVAQKVATTGTDEANIEHDPKASSNPSSKSYELSLGWLRPIGAGRGLVPLQPFPVVPSVRMRDLTNFGSNP
jgi:hypothetical protein